MNRIIAEVAAKVSRHLVERKAIIGLLARDGPRLMTILTQTRSLRDVARATGLSPTYLSHVANRQCVVSKLAFLKLAELERNGGD